MTERLEGAIDGVEEYLRTVKALPARDPKEPGRKQKHKAESRLAAVVRAHFKRQVSAITHRLETAPPMQKAAWQYNFDDLLNDGEWLPAVTRLLLQFVTEGVKIAGESFGIGIDYTLTNKPAAEWARQYAAKLVKGIDDTTRQNTRDAVADFIDTPGMTTGDLIDRLAPMFDPQRAETIATTEVTRSYAQSNKIYGMEAADKFPGVPMVHIWYTNRDDLVCPICAPLNAKRVKFGDMFDEENGIESPPAHVNCLLGDSLVLPIGGIVAVTVRVFDGDVFIINTASGKSLTATANHPILTDKGWVGAGVLDIGCNVISTAIGDDVPIGDIHNQNVPARFEDIAKTFRRSRHVFAAPVKVTAPDFHGDGMGSQVAVVYANCLLRDNINPTSAQHIAQYNFGGGLVHQAPLNGGGMIELAGVAQLAPLDVGVGSLRSALFGRHPLPFEKLGLGRSADVAPAGDQPLANCPPVDAKIKRYLKFGFTSGVFADNVISIQRKAFHGLVYNLQSESGSYIANGIITHNCRCWDAVTTDFEAIDGRSDNQD